MKNIVLAALTLMPALSFAGAPDLRCFSEKSRRVYIVQERFGQIHELDRSGRYLGYLDKLSFSSRRAGATAVTTATRGDGAIVAKIYATGPREVSMDYSAKNEKLLKCARVER